MQKNYSMETYGSNSHGEPACCLVRERPTGNVIATFERPRECRPFVNKLNGGAGFNGWTPTFLLAGAPRFGVDDE